MWRYMATILMAGSAAVQAEAWKPARFPIAYWYGPPPSANTRQTWQTVADAGFTVAGITAGYSVEDNLQRLDSCHELGLKAFVTDRRLHWDMVYQDGWKDRLDAVLADYSAHPALYGYHLNDEPSSWQFPALGRIREHLESKDPDHLAYINLLPTYANTTQLGTPTYADHLERFVTTVQPRVLSYDHYALLTGDRIRPDYFENLALVRDAALHHRVVPWQIVLAMAHYGYRDPSAADMRWQAYTSLAYGLKGLLYFTYWSVPAWDIVDEMGVRVTGIVDSEGKPGRLYPVIAELNREILPVGNQLLELTSTDVCHTGNIPLGAKRLGGQGLLRYDGDDDLAIGFFDGPERASFALIVNLDVSEPVSTAFTTAPHVRGVATVPEAVPDQVSLDGHTLSVSLRPGAGVLLRFETEFQYPQPPDRRDTIDFDFERPGDAEGWALSHNARVTAIQGGSLHLSIGADDPYICRRYLDVPADRYTALHVRMRIAGGEPMAQFFWGTSEDSAFSGSRYLNFPITPDGQWHEYAIPLGNHPEWRGKRIAAIRLDPTVRGPDDGTVCQIDWIRGE